MSPALFSDKEEETPVDLLVPEGQNVRLYQLELFVYVHLTHADMTKICGLVPSILRLGFDQSQRHLGVCLLFDGQVL